MTKQLQRLSILCLMLLATVVAMADNVVTAEWSWQNNLPEGICDATNFEGKTGTLASTVDGIELFVDATSGKMNSVGRNNAQCNAGTILQVPVVSTQDVVTVVGYPNYFTYNFNGGDDLTNENTFTATSADVKRGYVVINSKGGYVNSIKVEQHPDAVGNDWTYRDFGVDMVSILTDEQRVDKQAQEFGMAVAEDGTLTQVAADAPNANIVLRGTYWNSHGWTNTEAIVRVEGPVQIDLGNCYYGEGEVVVKNAEGTIVATGTLAKENTCWEQDHTSITSVKYTGEATTLTITYGSYLPYIGIKAIEATACNVSYSLGDAVCQGDILPAGGAFSSGDEYIIPAKNFTLYKEGYTLTGWTDGTNVYNAGQTITLPEGDLALTPVFTENATSLADRTEPVTLKFDFQRQNGAPTVAWQNKDGLVWVTQAEVNGTIIDVAAQVSTNPGKFANGNWTDWAQLNNGTKFTIPSCKNAVVSIEAYNALGTGDSPTTIDGQSDYTSAKTITYTIANSTEAIDVVIGSEGSYYRYIQTVLPVVENQGGEKYENEKATVVWAMTDPQNTNANEATPDGVFAVVAFDSGDTEITGTSNITDENAQKVTTGIKFRPSGSTKSLIWSVKPVAGLTFTPTKLTGYINRCGTDAEKGITISAYVGENAPTALGTWTALRSGKTNSTTSPQNATSKAYDATAIYKYEIELTAEQQAALTSADGFYLVSTVGVNSGKEGAFGEVTIEGFVNGTTAAVEKFTLTTAASPAEGGNISVYPNAETYEAGSEVTLTATENFGFDFVNWTNTAGEEVSAEPKFKFTMDAEETLTANFKKVNTYELALTVDGTNDYMVSINPAPTMVDGKKMYEEGQAVELTANQYTDLVTFANWSDGETNSQRLVAMTENVELTANYSEADIIAGWDFIKSGGSGRKADFYAQDNDGDALTLVNTETGESSGWLDKSAEAAGGYESFAGAAVNWRTGSKDGDVGYWHWQTKVNAEAFMDINVQFQMLYNFNAYQTYLAEYSLDGTEWKQFGTISMEGAKNPASFSKQLPAEANNQKELYIRMRADKTSKVDGSASANDGNALAMFFITGTPKLVDDGVAPALVSSVPAADATGVSASGKIVLTFDERVKMADGTVATLADQKLTPTVSGKVVIFEYKGLEYSTEYTFTLPANSISDLTDNMQQEDITLTFTTMVRPSVGKGLYDAVVSNVDELLAAFNAADKRSDKNQRFRIFVKNGTYKLPKSNVEVTYALELADGSTKNVTTTSPITYISSSNISFIGESRDGVVITNTIPSSETFEGKYGTASVYEGIGKSDVLQINSDVSGLYWQDLTVSTGMDDARGRDIAIQDKGTKNIYKNVCLHGYQDTWNSNNDHGLYYFEGGVVRGRTDYLCGKGDIFFNGVELRQIAGGYAAVPSKPAAKGWVFKNCVINGDGNGVDGKYTLGRPWGSGTPIALFIDTKMNVVPSAIGWNEMSNGWPARFAEWNSTTSTGTQIDLSGRKTVFGEGHANNPRLTAEEAYEASNLHNMYGDWDPTLATEQAPTPANVKIEGNVLTWDDSNYALLWAIVKNGSVIDFTIEPTYTVDDVTATYAVRAANEMGGLSEAVEAQDPTGIEGIANDEAAKADNTVYNLQGIRVKNATRGVYIINGKKVVK